MSTKCGDDPSMESTDIGDQNLICKCLGALEVSAVYDIVAQRFLDILNSIRSSFALPSANRQQKFNTKEDVSSTYEKPYPTRADTPSKLTLYILDIFRHPFGGESEVIGHDDYVLSRFFPDHWRFLVPEPSPGIGLKDPGSPGPGSRPPTDRRNKQDSRENRSPPFRTKEEYEAFFRRIS